MGDRYRNRYRTHVSSPSLWFFNRVYDRTPAVEGLTGDGGYAYAGDTRQLNAQRNIATGEMSLWTSLTI